MIAAPAGQSGGARWLIVAAMAASALLIGAYLAAGGSHYQPTPVADPCQPRDWTSPDSAEESAEQFFLSALDGAACELGVSRETLAAALATDEARQAFAAEHGVDGTELEAALRAGLVRAIDDAERAGAISAPLASGLREFASRVPVEQALSLYADASAFLGDAANFLGGLLP